MSFFSRKWKLGSSNSRGDFIKKTVELLDVKAETVENVIAGNQSVIKKYSQEHCLLIHKVASEKFRNFSFEEQQAFIASKRIRFKLGDIIQYLVPIALTIANIFLVIISIYGDHIDDTDTFSSVLITVLVIALIGLLAASACGLLRKKHRFERELIIYLDKISCTKPENEQKDVFESMPQKTTAPKHAVEAREKRCHRAHPCSNKNPHAKRKPFISISIR